MNGTWIAPAMARTKTPLGLDGEGALDWNDAGVTLTGKLQSKSAASVFGCLGFIVCFVLVIAIAIATGVKRGPWVALAILGLPGGVMLGRKLFPAKDTVMKFPWAEVKKLGIDGHELGRQVLSFTIKGAFFSFAPKGAVFFVPKDGTPDAALEQLRPFASRAGVTVDAPRV